MPRIRRRSRDRRQYALPAVSRSVTTAMAHIRQGDHIPGILALPVSDAYGAPTDLSTGEGVVVISQTCDVVQSNRLTVQLAPLVTLDGATAQEARDGRRPRYAHVPGVGEDAFADLEVVASVPKARLVGQRTMRGVHNDSARKFAYSVGRRYSRFAFPDSVVHWLQPLEEVAQSKSRKETSPEGRVFAKVQQLRVECENGWDAEPYDLVLAVIVESGELPTFLDDELPNLPDHLRSVLYDKKTGVLKRTASDIAKLLEGASSAIDRYFLWMALGEAWAAKCRPKASSLEVRRAVTAIRGEVVSADEYTFARMARSEVLDLDHLSPPLPR